MPRDVNVDYDESKIWTDLIKEAWELADSGKIKEARKKYQEADDMNIYCHMNPDLSVLRHSKGEATGRISPARQNEQELLGLAIDTGIYESPDAYGMEKPVIDGKKLEENIRTFLDLKMNFGFHKTNIKKELPHVWVISTGRCGTVSLYRLFEQSRLMAFHSYMWNPSGICQSEMTCRFISGNFNGYVPINVWLSCRAAEWLGAINEDRPMISCAHLDTIFAPVFAKLHTKGKVIHLHRNPLDVFLSFYNKKQWNPHQIFPCFYKFDPKFAWRRSAYDLTPIHAWYIYFVEEFCQAMVRVLGDRGTTISADKLFNQDKEEIQKLLDFTECDLSLDRAMDHFATKYNEKVEKMTLTPEGLDIVSQVFKESYERLKSTGSL